MAIVFKYKKSIHNLVWWVNEFCLEMLSHVVCKIATNISKGLAAPSSGYIAGLIFYPEYRGCWFLRYDGTSLPKSTASHPRSQYSYTLSWGPKMVAWQNHFIDSGNKTFWRRFTSPLQWQSASGRVTTISASSPGKGFRWCALSRSLHAATACNTKKHLLNCKS
jgi:hypothetical protein